MKILLCDDHALFRQGMRLVLSELDPEAQILESEEGEEALRIVAHDEDIDLLLLDLSMPGMDGWISLRQLRSRYPALPVVIVSASETPDDVEKALEGGASGFLPKSSTTDELVAALRQVLDGELYVPEKLLTPARSSAPRAEPAGADSGARLTGLSERQREVLELMGRGLTSREISEQLGLAEGTVATHIAGALEALGISNSGR
jgi:DNA-binding NarL/FixJ family response regulator